VPVSVKVNAPEAASTDVGFNADKVGDGFSPGNRNLTRARAHRFGRT
jgi:hypothetical protein